jgi:uncharacterized protein (DUF2237 family)
MNNKFSEMDVLTLGKALNELIQHEKTGFLQDGIIRTIAEEAGTQAINVFNTEYALLREIANRWGAITGQVK